MVDPVAPLESLDRSGKTTSLASPGTAPLLVVLGPTAAGKSALGLALAECLNGEIVNCDSVQIYRGFDVGAGKVPLEERRGIPHHLLDLVEPNQLFTAGDYRREATRAIESIREGGRVPVLVGGTGLYLRALLSGLFEGPPRSESLRARLKTLANRQSRRSNKGGDPFPGEAAGRGAEPAKSEVLHRLLRRLDPATAARIHPCDTQKLVRAIEVCLLARQPMSGMLERGRAGLTGYAVIKIGLSPDRAQLYERINRRVEGMFAAGLMEETRRLLARGDASSLKPLEALGYRQAAAAVGGGITAEEALGQAQAATRRYAKRQMTWFRRETEVTWFVGFGDDSEIQQQIFNWLRSQRGFKHASA
ncbi:MAG TPA: tRNA (adenosine(37)-N6)-dimethylallyltransferase MiaA [Terriglobia bacterium]|nr:tRNA (adenosine(37)-N6)-dimethylallyltransferase MiaA [Terriglobia bacterium]